MFLERLLLIVLLIHSVSSTEWIPVEGGTFITHDLEKTPLQIKTDSTAGSGNHIVLFTHTKDETGLVGGVRLKFGSTITYFIGFCELSSGAFPVQPPDEVDKIWTIRKTASDLNIICNEVELLHYKFSDSSDSRCVQRCRWAGDVVDKIQFSSEHDTASDYYRAMPTACPGFTVDRSVHVQGIWDDTDPGETVTINCQKKHVRDGSFERTCNTDVIWTEEAPLCKKLIVRSWSLFL
uniref:Putative secretory peptide-48 n=1 Tax=Pleurobrachia bachei TaxID=34499 RepID=M4H1R7_PLEBA|nr:putative secretory peptide-48 [Pleurobrachia bachei]|eukprot:sb/3469227/